MTQTAPSEKQFLANTFNFLCTKQVTANSNSCLQQLLSLTKATPYHNNNWNYKQWRTGHHTLVHIGVRHSHRSTNGQHGSEYMCGFNVSLSQKACFLLTGCAMMTTLQVFILTLGPHVKFGDDNTLWSSITFYLQQICHQGHGVSLSLKKIYLAPKCPNAL